MTNRENSFDTIFDTASKYKLNEIDNFKRKISYFQNKNLPENNL